MVRNILAILTLAVAGLVAAMSRAGHVDWRFTLGETAAAYRVASITMTFTAEAVMQLRDAVRIELDGLLGDHLSDVRYADANNVSSPRLPPLHTGPTA